MHLWTQMRIHTYGAEEQKRLLSGPITHLSPAEYYADRITRGIDKILEGT